ncbi:MAG: hypothetical protein E6J90_31970 [Deltaproteobacteria bacterium]|nr:MAG: hypothetical protein E6J90_31970 [Deltaproteobacteria bacterium]
MRGMLLLDERIGADGSHVRTWATSDGERIRLSDDGGAIGELPLGVVDHVMARYGRPLDGAIRLEGDSLTCGTCRLRRLRHRAAVDAEGRDYLVWERPGDEPVACIATTATAALRFLLARSPRGSPSGI